MVRSALKQAMKNAENRKQPISVSRTSAWRRKRTILCNISCFHGLKEKLDEVLDDSRQILSPPTVSKLDDLTKL